MYTLHMKNWFTHYHTLDGHGMIRRARYMVHDVRFWVVLIGIAMAIILTALIIWASPSGGTNQPFVFPEQPFYPISYSPDKFGIWIV